MLSLIHIFAYLNVRVFPVIIIAFVRCIRAPVFVAVKTVFKVADGRMIICLLYTSRCV